MNVAGSGASRRAMFESDKDAEAFVQSLELAASARSVSYVADVDSTNRLARERSAADRSDLLVVLAEYQTAGRGRHGRSWACPRGAGLLMSTVSTLPGTLVSGGVISPWVTAAGALAMAAAVRSVCGVQALVEWPNDLVVDAGDRMRKLGGVLVEPAERDRAAVIGIGVNVSATIGEFPEDVRPLATSLACAGASDVDRRRLCAAYLVELERRCADPGPLRAELADVSATVGRPYDDGRVSGVAVGIDQHMRLVVESPGGRRQAVVFRMAGEPT